MAARSSGVNPKGYMAYSTESQVLREVTNEKPKFYYHNPDAELLEAIEKINAQLAKINALNINSLELQQLKDLDTELMAPCFELEGLQKTLRDNDQWLRSRNWVKGIDVKNLASAKSDVLTDRINELDPPSP